MASTSSSSTVTTAAGTSTAGPQSTTAVTDIGPIKATTPMWRCSRIMHIQRDMHPTVLSALEGIVDQVCTMPVSTELNFITILLLKFY